MGDATLQFPNLFESRQWIVLKDRYSLSAFAQASPTYCPGGIVAGSSTKRITMAAFDSNLPAEKPGASSVAQGGKKQWLAALALAAGSGLVYYFSNPRSTSFYDYTFRIAGEMLHGRVGMVETPPPWLNEMVPMGDRYYSVFPLGSVLTMLPVALLQGMRHMAAFPSAMIVALAAGATVLLLFLLASRYDDTLQRRVLLALFPLFGTWMWCNLAFAGAWQIALGFAVLGQAGALYFVLVKRRPLVAGFFFALAFGNRTEVMLAAPVFLYLLARAKPGVITSGSIAPRIKAAGKREARTNLREPDSFPARLRTAWSRTFQALVDQRRAVALFLLFPLALGLLTLAYNDARFSSVSDFGYARIPGVLNEPWYAHGIFSLYAIPLNAHTMLFETWKRMDGFPYLVPNGFGESIFLSSPFLFLLPRRGARDRGLKRAWWMAIAILTFLLWCHGNPGGWQFSYRYAMVLLPWIFLILLENGPRKPSAAEWALLSLSILINGYATYLFLWTGYVKP